MFAFLASVPSIWPLVNVIKIITLPEEPEKSAKIHDADPEEKEKNTAQYTHVYELFIRYLRLSTYWIVAYCSMVYTFPSYSDLINDDLNTFDFYIKWSLIVTLRDFLIILVLWSFWHWILYQSRWAPKLKRLKYNKEYPPQSQWNRSRSWTLYCTGLIISLFEIFAIYLFKTNKHLLYKSFWAPSNITNWTQWFGWNIHSLFWFFIIPYTTDAIFYWMHRAIHPWRWKLFGLFDPGYYGYIYIHQLHHVDVNMGPWSSLCAHPIESIITLGACVIPLVFKTIKLHPLHFLFNKYYNVISTLPNHDGFDEPGGASYYHYLHHAHFECNYGSPMVPFDKWFGSFEDGKKYQKKEKRK